MTVHPTPTRLRRIAAVTSTALIVATLASCSSDEGSGGDGGSASVKLGYFPNLTHASAIVGIEKDYFEKALDEDGATLETLDFNSGSDTIDALLNGDLDATYIGPSPAITAYAT